jgi:hypothetical protein
MSDLFGRVCTITAWRAPSGFVGANEKYFEKLGNGIEFKDVRMRFVIEKHLSAEPNTCKLTISNLSQHERSEICRKPLHVDIAAGHDNAPRFMFGGDLHFGFSKYTEPDWETELQVADGGRAYAHAFISKSYKAPITVEQVLTDAARSMNLQLPPEVEQSPEMKQALATGISLHGPTRDALTRLLAPYGYNWSVQSGRLQILRDDQVRSDRAILVNKTTGLIGEPSRSPPDKTTGRSEVTFDMLLYPELTPGCTVQLESQDISGIFKLIQVTHTGDTRGDDWTSAVKVVPR